jgi:hypothetical protein
MTPDPGATARSQVSPAYGDRSLADVLPAVSRALGLDGVLPPTRLELPAADRYVVLLIDGLGHEQLAAHPDDAPFLHEHLGEPATAAVPSTTAASLTSFGTASAPGRHGVVGFTSRIPGTQDLLNALYWSNSVDPREWQPHPTAFDRLEAAGVATTVVNKRAFESSGLTVAGFRGARFVGADKVGESLAGALEAVAGQPRSLTYLYDGDLDWTGHRHGVDSVQWRAQLGMTDAEAEHLRDSLPDDVRIVVVADHGMVDSPEDRRVDVAEHAELADGVFLLGGEARFRHLYCRSGADADVQATWQATLGDRAEVLLRDEAIARGWFGEVEDRVRPRLGDVVAAARDDWSLMSSEAFAYEMTLVGLHGSLTSAEMLVPLIVL